MSCRPEDGSRERAGRERNIYAKRELLQRRQGTFEALEERGKLVRVKQRINKDTELMPLVRWQFRGLEESQRKAFFFQNVFDVKGKSYSMPVTVGTLAASTEIYSIGLKCKPEEIHERWTRAQSHPIAP